MAGVDAWAAFGEVGGVDEASDVVAGRGCICTQGPDALVAGIGVGKVGADTVGVVGTQGCRRVMEGEGNDVDGLSS